MVFSPGVGCKSTNASPTVPAAGRRNRLSQFGPEEPGKESRPAAIAATAIASAFRNDSLPGGLLSHAVHSITSAVLACASAARTKRENRSQLMSYEVMLPPWNEWNSPER